METAYVTEVEERWPRAAAPPEDTVQRAQAGDADAFERLYRAHVQRVYVLCLRMVRDEESAEELTQEVFIRVWEKLGSFRGEAGFGTWLHRVAVNVVLKHLRSRKRRDQRESTSEDLSRYAAAARRAMPETRIDLERAIALLPPGAREVLLLHDIEGYRYREIAELMGTAEGTVKSQLHRARKIMQKALER